MADEFPNIVEPNASVWLEKRAPLVWLGANGRKPNGEVLVPNMPEDEEKHKQFKLNLY